MPFSGPSARFPFTSICRQCRRRLLYQSSQKAFASQSTRPVPIAVANESGQHEADSAKSLPRWAQTPQAMKAPFKSRPLNDNDDYPVNEDPQVLNDAYKNMLGQDGDRILTEDVKWLAVTHKSFDHGRRGFNDRLAFLGRRIVGLQTSLGLLDATPDPSRLAKYPRQGSPPAESKALFNIENVNDRMKSEILSNARLEQLAHRYGLHNVIRWKPRLTKDLKASGQQKVLIQTIYAIVGAIALQKGGEEAKKVTRERILGPLGL